MNEDTWSRAERWSARCATACNVLVILWWGVRAAIDGWYPTGDNALLTLRARDVLTANHPWLGTWTSASLSIGTPINNPGPLQFDLLAIFAKLDAEGGMAIGVATVNAVAVVLIAVFARRAGGHRFAAASMVAASLLIFAMGSELLVDPWQPHHMLLPFLLLIVLSVALASGDVAALPWAVGVVSVLVQTHLSYAVLAPGILAVGLACVVLALHSRVGDRFRMDARPARAALRRAVLVAVAVGLACWAQPLWEQVAREGNLLEVAGSASDGDAVVGPRSGVRMAGTVIGDPSGWLRGSFQDTFQHDYLGEQVAPVGPPNAGVRSFPTAVASVLGVVALLAAGGWAGWRRRLREGTAVAVVVGAAVVLAVVTCATLPASEVLGVAAHQLRWLWPIAIAGAVLPWAGLLPRRPAVTLGLAAVAVAAGIATLVPANAEAGPSADVAARPAVRAFAASLDGVPSDEVVYFDGQTVPFAEPFSGPLLLELQRRGIPFEVDPDPLSYQVGPERRGPRRATTQILLLVGDPSGEAPAGSEVLGRIDGLAPDERMRVEELADRLRSSWDGTEVRLNARGRAAQAAGALGELDPQGSQSDVRLMVDRAVLARLVDEEWVDLDSVPDGAEEWGRLEQRGRRYSVVVALQPLDR